MANSPRRHGVLSPTTEIMHFLRSVSPAWRRMAVAALGEEHVRALEADWTIWAHEGQLAPRALPDGADWSTWVLMAGRGFGKTLAGAKWLTQQIAAHDPACGEPLSIALVGASLEDARRVMVEGRCGLLIVAAAYVADWTPSLRRLTFTTGAEATIFSGASPDLLRGPEHHLAWCDELAKWPRAKDCWDMLQLGLRLGEQPRALVTTTPRSGPVLRAIMTEPGTVVTHGRTCANPHTSAAWKARIEAIYAGTRLGEQELEGKLLPEAGALWTPELIEKCRFSGGFALPLAGGALEGVPLALAGGGRGGEATTGLAGHALPQPLPPAGGGTCFTRTLIAVDPPSGDGTCGIVACARDAGGIAHVLADHSVTGRSPEGWARAVAAAAAAHDTAQVIAEANQGGKMVKAIIETAAAHLRVRLVTATVGKSARAEPVSHLFEAGKVRLWGTMPELEAQLCGLIAGGGYEGPGSSPDRADAMVWGVGEVMRGRAVRVRGV